jgi:hypothetical protein
LKSFFLYLQSIACKFVYQKLVLERIAWFEIKGHRTHFFVYILFTAFNSGTEANMIIAHKMSSFSLLVLVTQWNVTG